MVRRTRAQQVLALLPLLGMVLMSACAGGGSTAGGPTATASHPLPPTAAPCATRATTSALVYANGPQVYGDIPAPSGPPTSVPPVLSNFTYPLGIPDENAVGNAPRTSFIAIAPDAAHLAVAIQQIVPFTAEYSPYIVDTSTHAVSRVMLPHPITVASSAEPPRLLAWADTHTLLIFGAAAISNRGSSGVSYSYDVTTHALTPLAGVSSAIEGVVRCSTLFYASIGSFSPISSSDPNHTTTAPTFINRYDLVAHSAIGSQIAIGQASTYGGAEGQVDFGGWDASPDGRHIVYQHEIVTGGPTIHSTWFAASANGSGAVPILPALTSTNGAFMSISPSGTLVAVTNASPAPNVAYAPLSGGTTVFFNSPSGFDQPAWLASNDGFYAGGGSGEPTAIAAYLFCGSTHCTGAIAEAQGNNPATLP